MHPPALTVRTSGSLSLPVACCWHCFPAIGSRQGRRTQRHGRLHVRNGRAWSAAPGSHRNRGPRRCCNHHRLEDACRRVAACRLLIAVCAHLPSQSGGSDSDGHVPQERRDRRRLSIARGQWRRSSEHRSARLDWSVRATLLRHLTPARRRNAPQVYFATGQAPTLCGHSRTCPSPRGQEATGS
jgi:hypothetical protein